MNIWIHKWRLLTECQFHGLKVNEQEWETDGKALAVMFPDL